MNRLYVPADIQCFWCNGHMQEKGATCMGSGLNCVSYFCKDCGGIAHFARHDDKIIKTFTIGYTIPRRRNIMTDYCPWCSAPETICPHWIGLDCELIEKEIDFEALERYLIKVCKDE